MLAQVTSTMPVAKKLMILFAGNTLLCFVLVFLMGAYFKNTSHSADSLCIYTMGTSLAQNLALNSDVECPVLKDSAELSANKAIFWQSEQGELQSIPLIVKSQQLSSTTHFVISAWLLLLGGCLSLAWCFANTATQRVMTPVYHLLEVIKSMTETRDYSIRSKVNSNDALEKLSKTFNDMISDIEVRNQDLVRARSELEVRVREVDISNRELSTTLQRLKATQQQLINNEKMASLGGLVAGVAHEINTPVGVGVTAASTLSESTRSVGAKYDRGELTNSALKQYLSHATSAAEIILGNLERAANLIQSFKQIAVDQSNSEVRTINLNDYLSQVLVSLNPQLRKTKLRSELICPADIEISSYPGALSQIVANFVMNSIMHAYDEDETGCLSIEVNENTEGEICIRYSDDGKGILPENISRVWDPFYTTNRTGGGSGLGLHIVYNLVTQQLCGNVEIESRQDYGTTISLFLPKDVGKVISNE